MAELTTSRDLWVGSQEVDYPRQDRKQQREDDCADDHQTNPVD